MLKVKNVLVIYGGVSPEHEVSVITAMQVMGALGKAGFGVMPLYISKSGEWLLGNERFLKPEIYNDLGKLSLIGKRVMLSADRGVGLLVKGWLGF